MEKIKLFYDRKTGAAYCMGEAVLVLNRINPSSCLMGVESYMGRGANAVLYNSSKNIAKKRFYKMVKNPNDGEKAMREILDRMSLCGYGLFRIKGFGDESLIEVRNSFNALKYKSDRPRCCMMAGMLAGVSELITGKESICIEEKCVSKGDRICVFRVTKLPSGEDAKPVKDWWKGRNPPEGAEELFLDYDEKKGEVFFKGMTSSIVFSVEERSELQKDLEMMMGPASKTIMYESVGRISTKEAITRMQKISASIFRFVSKRKIAERLLENYSQRGSGIMEIAEFDEKNVSGRIIVRNSHFARSYKKSKEPVCHAMAGTFAAGGDIIFGTRIECKETKCLTMGHPYCEFKLFRGKQ